MRIGLDAMGGDHAPAEEVRGALTARELLGPEDKIVLVGRREAILEHLAGADDWERQIEIVHAEQVVAMDEPPVEAMRNKPDSSIAVLAHLAAEKKVDACVSAGNTGACVAAAQMRLRRLPGVHRPGIAVLTPTFHGPVVLCDVGANVQCRPLHLYQYGIMASVYSQTVCGRANPRVAILSIGEEDAKGNSLVKETRELFLDDKRVNFIGNAEGRDLFAGVCDVMVCDGFVGNVALKLVEGMADGVIRGMMSEIVKKMPQQAQEIRNALAAVLGKYDFNEYGGAPLLGVGGIVIICHGASNFRGFYNAIRVAMDFSKQHVNQRITELLNRQIGAANA